MSKQRYTQRDSGLLLPFPDVWVPRERRRVDWRRWSPGYPCCCDGCDGCYWCTNCDHPEEFSVELSALQNNWCSECADVDGTYVLQAKRIVNSPVLGACTWEYVFDGDDPCCVAGQLNVIQLHLSSGFVAGTIRLNVNLYLNGWPHVWEKVFPAEPDGTIDCQALSGEDIPVVPTTSSYGECFVSAAGPGGVDAICTVTAL